MENNAPFVTSIICFLVGDLLVISIFIAAGIRIVREDTRLSVYRLGRYVGDKGPGLVLLIPIIDKGEIKQLGGVEKTPSTRLVGAVGETLTSVFRDGKVLFSSGEWDAVSQIPIASGRRVRVVRMLLEVEEE
ncbi:MAG: NfeD family protein [Chloroflexota bacterium]